MHPLKGAGPSIDFAETEKEFSQRKVKHESDPISCCRSSVPDRRHSRGPTGFPSIGCLFRHRGGHLWSGLSDHWRILVSEQQDSILLWRYRTSYRSLCWPGDLTNPSILFAAFLGTIEIVVVVSCFYLIKGKRNI